MNFFCRIFGHTWVPKAENPKTAWNNEKSGQLLVARPSAAPRFYDECARCRERRDVTVPPQAKAG